MNSSFSNFLWGIRDAFQTGIAKTPEEFDYLIKYLFARKFGWTPEQVDKLSYKDILVFLELLNVESKTLDASLNVDDKIF